MIIEICVIIHSDDDKLFSMDVAIGASGQQTAAPNLFFVPPEKNLKSTITASILRYYVQL